MKNVLREQFRAHKLLAAYIGRARVVPLRNTGVAISPFNAFLILQGIETLALRLERITEDTVRLSIGIEHIDDLLADLDQALAKV